MAKITQYPAKTVPSNNDEFILHDPSSGSTKKMTRGDLIGGAPLPANSVNNQAIADDTIHADKLDSSSFNFVSVNTSNNNVNSSSWYSQYSHTVPASGVYLMIFSQRMLNGDPGNDFRAGIFVDGVERTSSASGGSTWVNYIQATAFHVEILNAGAVVSARSRGGGGASFTTSNGRFISVRIA